MSPARKYIVASSLRYALEYQSPEDMTDESI